jgi:hypothetical protein
MKVTLKDQLLAFREGKYLDSDGTESFCYNFYDWFCKEDKLQHKADTLFVLAQELVNKLNIDTEKYYVFFKNNCTGGGTLYDDLRICDIETGMVVWNFTPKSGHSRLAELYFAELGFKEPMATAETAKSLLKML